MNNCVIVVAGGGGSRMGSEIPKQFLTLNNTPVLMHTIKIFYVFARGVSFIFVLLAGDMGRGKTFCLKHTFIVRNQKVPGGRPRFH